MQAATMKIIFNDLRPGSNGLLNLFQISFNLCIFCLLWF